MTSMIEVSERLDITTQPERPRTLRLKWKANLSMPPEFPKCGVCWEVQINLHFTVTSRLCHSRHAGTTTEQELQPTAGTRPTWAVLPTISTVILMNTLLTKQVNAQNLVCS